MEGRIVPVKPKAPPILRKKFRKPQGQTEMWWISLVTTALSDFGAVACAATSAEISALVVLGRLLGWNVHPTPNPSTINVKIMRHPGVD
jgi:hypothetical protein